MNEQIGKFFLEALTIDERFELLKKVESDGTWRDEFAKCQYTIAALSASDSVVDREESKRSYRTFMQRTDLLEVTDWGLHRTGDNESFPWFVRPSTYTRTGKCAENRKFPPKHTRV
jgi:hypothetical protein